MSYSNLLGYAAGAGISDSVQNMNVFGRLAGLQANNSANSNFIGGFAGAQSTNSANSNFLGADAGNNADQSFCANFIGSGAGSQSKNSAFSNFIGFLSGNNMISSYGNDSIFIGTSAGAGDNLSNYGEISYSSLSGTFTIGEGVSSSSGGSAYIMFDNGTDLRVANVQGDFNISDTITGDGGATANLDYFSTSKASILIGNNTSTGDYYNSIAIGNGATNTANNEIVIESTKGLENLKLKLDHTQQSAVSFTGSGLDDLEILVNSFSGTYPTTYTVTIDGINKDILTVTTSSISGGTFAVSDTVINGLGASATIDAISTLPADDKTFFVISSYTGTFNDGDTIDNGSGVTATQNGSVAIRDTFTWTDGTTTVTETIAVDSNGVVAGFSASTGHTLTDEWTWDYTTVNQNVLDFSNNDYKFGATIGADTFKYEIGDDILGFGLKGSLNTWTTTGGDIGVSGLTNLDGNFGSHTFLQWAGGGASNYSLSRDSATMRINYLGNKATLNLFPVEFDLIGSTSSSSYGLVLKSNVLSLGNLSGGNNTKITIDDVNEQITISNLSAYDDDTAAGVGGLTAGMVYMTTGSGSAPLNAAGILMIKQ